jgi:hypothetical protein
MLLLLPLNSPTLQYFAKWVSADSLLHPMRGSVGHLSLPMREFANRQSHSKKQFQNFLLRLLPPPPLAQVSGWVLLTRMPQMPLRLSTALKYH